MVGSQLVPEKALFQIWQTNNKYKKLVDCHVFETSIKLGRGITRNSFSFDIEDPLEEEFFFNAIGKFGISSDSLRKINPSFDDLLEIYSELKTFGISLKYYEKLRNLHQSTSF